MDFQPQKIVKLDESVVNRIAAGEIVQAPMNCVKELIENCIDAKATNICVVLKMGGLKSIQIADNGTGILKENFEILCERFTTSKLQKYEDLQHIGTYGFRGEALSSISMISRLTIQTKTRDEVVAYKVKYENGSISSAPVPCAGNQGTIITIDDLFYNVPIRQKTLKSPFEEFTKIFDLIAKYAVHNYKISFTLKKHGENNSIKTQISQSPVDVTRVIYGNEVANSLLKVEAEDEDLKFKMTGYVSNANYSGKKGQFLLFINHRLVESKTLKKALFDDLYRTVLTNTVHPFIYMSIEIDTMNVDVNVSPTKHEVSFLNEELIVEKIRVAAEAVLLATNETRKMYTQQLLPGATKVTFENSFKEKERIYAKDMVRTDPKSQSIIKFFNTSNSENTSHVANTSPVSRKSFKKEIESTQLSSIKELLAEIDEKCDENLKEQVRNLKFVGNVNRSKSLIQCENVLYLCDTRRLGWELFYQQSLKFFENFDAFEFEEPLKVSELALIGFNLKECSWTEEDGPKEELSQQVERILTKHSEMLKEYFSITINDDNCLVTLPIIVPEYAPIFAHIPLFLIRLAADVNFEDEKECFRNICSELATFYSKWSLQESNEKEFNYLMEHIIFPKIQSSLQPPEKFLSDGTFIKLTSLQELYKVFERC